MFGPHIELALQQLLIVSTCAFQSTCISQTRWQLMPSFLFHATLRPDNIPCADMASFGQCLRASCKGSAWRACVYAHWQAHVGRDACACAVQRQLGDRYAYCLHSQVSQIAHALAVCQADGLDSALRPVLQQRVHAACSEAQLVKALGTVILLSSFGIMLVRDSQPWHLWHAEFRRAHIRHCAASKRAKAEIQIASRCPALSKSSSLNEIRV